MSNDQNIRVCCRFRPVNKIEMKSKGHKIVAKVGNDSKTVTIGHGKKTKYFQMDYIFPSNSTQQTVFTYSALPLVDNVLAGYNCTLFAYGQTGSGKTYSMEGVIGDRQNEGLIPRMVRMIFNRILDNPDEDTEFEYTVRVSFVEIYNEKLRDLLHPHGPPLKIREKLQGGSGVYIDNVHAPFVASPEEVFDHLTNGHVNRSVASTRMNEHSSRSHAVFMLQIDAKNTETGSHKQSKLMMVDLAGSEKVRKTNATGQTLKEAQQINKSLMVLGLVINSLVENKKHIPYRDSKLTRLLSDALGGNSKTCLIVTASPSKYNEDETKSTLRFGQRAKSIKNVAKVNQELSVNEYKKLLDKSKKREEILKAQIRSLQAQNVAFREALEKNKIDIPNNIKMANHSTVNNTQMMATLVPDKHTSKNGHGSSGKHNHGNYEKLQEKLEKIADEKHALTELLDKKKEELSDQTSELNELHTHLQEIHVQMDELKKRYEELFAAKNHVDKLFQSMNSGKDANKERYETEREEWNEDRLQMMDELRVKNNKIQEMEIKLIEAQNMSNNQFPSSSMKGSDDAKENGKSKNSKNNNNNANRPPISPLLQSPVNDNSKERKAQMIALVDAARKYRSQNEKNFEEIKKLREKLKAYKRRDEVNKQLRDNWNKQLNQMEQAVLLANEIYNRERTRHEAEMAEKDVEICKLRKFLLSFTNRHAKLASANMAKQNSHKNSMNVPGMKHGNSNIPGARKSKIVVPKVIKVGALKNRTFKKKNKRHSSNSMDRKIDQ